MSYSRFAIYFVPPDGPLAEFGAKWLGWDVVRGQAAVQYPLQDLHDITVTPMKYGFHGTLKPPFKLADGMTDDQLHSAVAKMAATVAPDICDGLELTTLGRFLALTPRGNMAGLQRIAEACVRELDSFRAVPSEAELARRRKSNLSARQEVLLTKWGYPYVMDEFRFHMTLSGRLKIDEIATWSKIAQSHLPDLPSPFVVDQIALCGEQKNGRFELIHRYTLSG